MEAGQRPTNNRSCDFTNLGGLRRWLRTLRRTASMYSNVRSSLLLPTNVPHSQFLSKRTTSVVPYIRLVFPAVCRCGFLSNPFRPRIKCYQFESGLPGGSIHLSAEITFCDKRNSQHPSGKCLACAVQRVRQTSSLILSEWH